jgi:dihydroorotate dehydrogenase (fumarate)
MDLSTRYLGLRLKSPLVVGASPMVDDLDTVRRLEDAGAAAIVMHSLFEEQLTGEQLYLTAALESGEHAFAEARSFLPRVELSLGPDEYLERIRKLKETVAVPVIASLNGSTAGGWLAHGKLMEEAGADALELNVYYLAADAHRTAEMLERHTLAMVAAVKHAMRIPVAVKLSPFYTSLANFARRLDETGVDGLVLFNRFYQPDLDPEALEVERRLRLSDDSELPLRLRWLALLSGRLRASLACSGGVHGARDVVKAVMAGAHAVQLVSALLRHGPDYLRLVRDELIGWMREHDQEWLEELRGCLDLAHCPDPAAYERANYVQMLQGWSGWTTSQA